MKRILCALLAGWMVVGISGCSIEKIDKKKEAELTYQTVEQDQIPIEMKAEIEKEKGSPFHLTYDDGTFLYIGQGYGRQETAGYSIRVLKCYESSNSICFKTSLTGPKGDEGSGETGREPYLVVKLASNSKRVVFL